MRYVVLLLILLISSILSSACQIVARDRSGPAITDVSTSSTVVVISDCQNDSVTVSARVTDASTISQVLIWIRVGSSGPFTSLPMNRQGDIYSATVKGAALSGYGYGNLEFYITAQDEQGNSSESPKNDSIQFLPCVSTTSFWQTHD